MLCKYIIKIHIQSIMPHKNIFLKIESFVKSCKIFSRFALLAISLYNSLFTDITHTHTHTCIYELKICPGDIISQVNYLANKYLLHIGS